MTHWVWRQRKYNTHKHSVNWTKVSLCLSNDPQTSSRKQIILWCLSHLQACKGPTKMVKKSSCYKKSLHLWLCLRMCVVWVNRICEHSFGPNWTSSQIFEVDCYSIVYFGYRLVQMHVNLPLNSLQVNVWASRLLCFLEQVIYSERYW